MNQKFVFQGVGMLFSGGFSDSLWGPDETRECRFVFIGKNLDLKKLNDGFVDCKCTEELRFKIGDAVKAKVGKGDADGFFPGKILKLWDQGNPYRTELQDEENTNVWGPQDDDTYIRSA
eukprot:COSAG05_NODE_6970_length_873_cov_1.290698_2_plen_119_part_00